MPPALPPDDPHHCINCGYPHPYYLHCKIRCPNCGFTLDCSDLDVGGEIKRRALQAEKASNIHPPDDLSP